MRNVLIIGGGLAGLISSIQLIRAGISSTVVEKKSYPLHRVCGEYISNEALPFLKDSGLYPNDLELPQIKFFEFSSVRGSTSRLRLDLGGFGISRYAFDTHLFNIARKEGVVFVLETEATEVVRQDERFIVRTTSRDLSGDVVVGSFGKRSRIDVHMGRNFIRKRSPWVGVKYHVRTSHPDDLVSLHNFPGGYCGVCNVEDGVTNLCYLTHRENLKKWGSIPKMEEQVLFRNPLLKNIFSNAEFIFDRPEVINEISFETKGPVNNHILLAGDAAGMITPVCGNGMAMAIHSGKMLAHHVNEFCANKTSRHTLEENYKRAWNHQFRSRLWVGRRVQSLFGSAVISSLAVGFARAAGPFANLIASKTHGQSF